MGSTSVGAGRTGPGTAWVRLAAVAIVAAVLAACAPAAKPNDKATLTYVKQTVFGQYESGRATGIANGAQQPVLGFTVENSPPSIFVNWSVPDAQAAAFAAAAGLPPGFTLSKIRILESDPLPRYWVSLNVYRVSGITTGLRAEWSTYVDDGTGTPRFMIIRARTDEGSLDPLGPVAQPEPINHSLGQDGVIHTAMNKTVLQDDIPVWTPDNLFNSTIGLPQPADRNYVDPTGEWVTANDFIYWVNGVKDRTFYNSTAHSAPIISVDLADVTIDDDSEWAPFVDPTPQHVLVYLDRIEFEIGPWWNVTEPDGRVDPGTRAALLSFKNSTYGGLAQLQALSVQSGNAEPVVLSTIEDSPPSVYWHWQIPDAELAAFEDTIGLPAGLSLAAVRLQSDDTEAGHWLSLHVYRSSGLPSGLRAEWTTTVDDGTGPRTLILEARSDTAALDPTNVVDTTYPYTPGTPLTHSVASTTVATTVGSGLNAFTSSFGLPAGPASTVQASREWVGANDLRYWMNRVADRVYYDGTAFGPKVSIDPAGVALTDGGQWAAFTGTPDHVWVDQEAHDLVTNPWWNLKGL